MREPDFRLFWIGIIFLIMGTIFFRFDGGKYDILITDHYYHVELPVGERFFLARAEPWATFKKNDGTFTVIPVIFCFYLIGTGLIIPKQRPLVRYGSFGLLALIIGPGLLVNVLFKGFWGRPRPSQTNLWPNSLAPDNLPFYKVWDPAFADGLNNTSFPSGHVSAVVVSVVLFYMFKHPATMARISGDYAELKIKLFTVIKYAGLIIAWAGGILMGFARIVQGAHHASDVLWSYGMVIPVTWGLYYYVFRIPAWEQKQGQKKPEIT